MKTPWFCTALMTSAWVPGIPAVFVAAYAPFPSFTGRLAAVSISTTQGICGSFALKLGVAEGGSAYFHEVRPWDAPEGHCVG